MNFSRKTILVVGAALLAACGDKVTVQEYTPPTTTPKVNFVEVTPATATVSTGASITFTAAVNADAGLATSVTWSASAGTVTSAGVFTAPTTANPGISVCATSTVDTGKKGCATVVVTAPTAAIPASVSINSISRNGVIGGATNDPTNTFGIIDVTLNVSPGNQTVSKIVLTVGGIRVDSQTFTAAQSAALRYAADEAVAAQSTFPQVVFSVNTAAFNATTGVPRWMNGTQGVSAQLYTTQGGTAAAASASAQTNLTFANINTVTGSISVTGGNSTTDANGYAWKSGKLGASIIPVIYTVGSTASAVVVNFGNGACDNSGAGVRSKPATASGTSWSVTFDNTGASDATNVSAFEFGPVLCAANYTAGGQLATVDIVDSNGAPIVIGAALGRVRLDNLAPVAPTFSPNPNGRAGGWINPTIALSAQGATNVDGWLVANPADLGVGGPAAMFKVGADQATAIASTTFYTSTASLNPTVDAVSQCAVLYAKDKLGNTSADPAAAACGAPALGVGQMQYGFDKVAPNIGTILLGTSTSSSRRRTGANLAEDFNVPVTDTGVVGNSGVGAAPIRGYVKLRNVAGTTCIVADPATLTTTCDAATNVNNAARISLHNAFTAGYSRVVVAAETGNGYYTLTVWAADAAGNVTPTKTRVTLLDNVAPSVTTASLSNAANTNSGFGFTSLASDNLDLQNYRYFVTYGGAAPAMFDVDPTAGVAASSGAWRENFTRTGINTSYNAATFQYTNIALPGTTTLPLTLQAVAVGVPAAWSAADKMTTLSSEVRDQRSLTVTTATGIAGAIVPPAASMFTTGGLAPATDITAYTFFMYNAAAFAYNATTFTACSGAATRDTTAYWATGTAGCQAVALPLVPEPSSIAVRVSVTGTTGAMLQPFTKVYLVTSGDVAAGSNLVTLATLTLSSGMPLDNGATRVWRYEGTLPLDANTYDLMGGCSTPYTAAFGACAGTLVNGNIQRNVWAVGVDANGRIGLISDPVAVTLKN